MLARSLLALLATSLLLPATAAARTHLVLGPGVNPDAAGTLARPELGDDEFEVAGALAELTGASPDALAVVGAGTRRCEATSSETIERVLLTVKPAIDEMRYGPALRELEAFTDALPCGAERATRDQLYDAYFLMGYAHYVEGQQDLAVRDFANAAAFDPTRKWNDRYPPTAKETFLSALQRVFEAEPLPLRIDVDGAVVDGEKVETGSKIRLAPGGHIVRVAGETLLLQVPFAADRADETAILTTARQLVVGLSLGEPEYAPWLADLAAANSWDEVLVVGEGVHRLEGRSFPANEKPAGPPPGAVAGGLLMGVGAGTTGVGLGLNIVSWQDAGVVPDDGRVTVGETEYDSLVSRNRAGLGTAIAGGVVLAAGVVITISTAVKPKAGSPATAVAPWFVPTADGGVAFGIGGAW